MYINFATLSQGVENYEASIFLFSTSIPSLDHRRCTKTYIFTSTLVFNILCFWWRQTLLNTQVCSFHHLLIYISTFSSFTASTPFLLEIYLRDDLPFDRLEVEVVIHEVITISTLPARGLSKESAGSNPDQSPLILFQFCSIFDVIFCAKYISTSELLSIF